MTILEMGISNLVHGEFAAFRTEEIDPMGRDIQAIKLEVAKIRDTFAPRLEIADRLRVIERKLGIRPPG